MTPMPALIPSLELAPAAPTTTAPPPRPRGRLTTESPLEMPTVARTVTLLGRSLRLRCPHCGGGKVFGPRFEVRGRCAACGFRFERSDDHYFGGAVFCNLMMAEGLFFVSFVVALVTLWPNVPWDALTYGSMAAMVILPVVLHPFSKALWLTVDVLVRPVTTDELAAVHLRVTTAEA
jgi:uncharacterized protein (DUF983 family)